jgi:hypothetical protein
VFRIQVTHSALAWSFAADKRAAIAVLRQQLEKLETLVKELAKANKGGMG